MGDKKWLCNYLIIATSWRHQFFRILRIIEERELESIQSDGDIGLTFATPDSPWIRYLPILQNDCGPWGDASDLLDQAYCDIECSRRLGNHINVLDEDGYLGDYDGILDFINGKILDIDKNNVVSDWRTLVGSRLRDRNTRSTEANHFIEGIRQCEQDVNTRILLILDCAGQECINTLARVLFYHILGIELDMRPAEVGSVLGLRPETPFRPAYTPNVMYFGANRQTPICAFLGSRLLNGNLVDHGENARFQTISQR